MRYWTFRPTSALPGFPQYSFFSDFPCLLKWLTRLVQTNSAVLPGDIRVYPIPYKNWNRANQALQIFAIPMHIYHRFWLSVVLCDDLHPSLLGSMLVISPHMHSIWMPLVLDFLFYYRFLSGILLPCKEGNDNPKW